MKAVEDNPSVTLAIENLIFEAAKFEVQYEKEFERATKAENEKVN